MTIMVSARGLGFIRSPWPVFMCFYSNDLCYFPLHLLRRNETILYHIPRRIDSWYSPNSPILFHSFIVSQSIFLFSCHIFTFAVASSRTTTAYNTRCRFSPNHAETFCVFHDCLCCLFVLNIISGYQVCMSVVVTVNSAL